MWPILFTLGSVKFYTLGFLLAVGFFIGAFVVWRRLMELGLKEEKVIDLILWLVFWGLIFARLAFIAQNFDSFLFLPVRWLFWRRYPGFSFLGGLFGLGLSLAWFCRREKWDFWQIIDELVFGLLPFLTLFQLGSFLDGSEVGKPTSMPWGVFFPGSLVRQQPVALFAALGLFIIWLLLLQIERHWRMWEWYKSKASGFLSLFFLGLFFLLSFGLSFLKDSLTWVVYLESGLTFLALLVSITLFYRRSGRSLLKGLPLFNKNGQVKSKNKIKS